MSDEIRCRCCGATGYPISAAVPYCDDCNTDTCGHWEQDEALRRLERYEAKRRGRRKMKEARL